MRLAELERLLAEELFGPGPSATMLEQIRCVAGRAADAQFAVVRGSVRGVLVRALEETYPVCARLVGARFFGAMAERYAKNEKSRTPDLGEFGATLAEFIDGFAPAASLPYLPDVARLEWAWHRAFRGKDAGTLDFAGLAVVPEERHLELRFEMPPASSLLASAFPVDRIWQTNQPEATGDEAVSLDEGGARLMVWRRGMLVHIDRLEREEWAFLSGVERGKRLGEILDGVDGQAAAGVLPRLVERGWICGFEV